MLNNKVFGLVGYPLSHSYSKQYFTDKFIALNLRNYQYKEFEIKNINDLENILTKESNLCGFNVTSPYKEQIIPMLNDMNIEAKDIMAVNTVKIINNNDTKELIGYNTDCYGFISSLKENVDIKQIKKAVVLGSGGAAKAVYYSLKEQNIEVKYVSRKQITDDNQTITYEELNDMSFDDISLIVNATPCSMKKGLPPIAPINTNKITNKNIVFDLIYNPSITPLLSIAQRQGAKTINGLSMLHQQAEKSWQIWNSEK
ncbi:MAG: shikimate dehydrogenase [Bacteroidales bacterium]|jgi:shikimate dehydrogenase|nr:shikimate dehydrogenase [Bacteroidales bacterium]